LQRLKTDREFFKQVNEGKPLRSFKETIKRSQINIENIFDAQKLKQNLSNTFDALLKRSNYQNKLNQSCW
jgi:hypothetical protein